MGPFVSNKALKFSSISSRRWCWRFEDRSKAGTKDWWILFQGCLMSCLPMFNPKKLERFNFACFFEGVGKTKTKENTN